MATPLPHGAVRFFHPKSTCLTQSTLGPRAVQIWSRDARKFELLVTKPSKFTVWRPNLQPRTTKPQTPNPKPRSLNPNPRPGTSDGSYSVVG